MMRGEAVVVVGKTGASFLSFPLRSCLAVSKFRPAGEIRVASFPWTSTDFDCQPQPNLPTPSLHHEAEARQGLPQAHGLVPTRVWFQAALPGPPFVLSPSSAAHLADASCF